MYRLFLNVLFFTFFFTPFCSVNSLFFNMRNCNLTLSLLPPPSDDHHLRQKEPVDKVELLGENLDQNHETQNQQLTIFYDGRVSVCDVTDIQAKAILKLASEEMERSRTLGSATSSYPSSPFMVSSMKMSLQRFLQKRKHRINQATSPYHH